MKTIIFTQNYVKQKSVSELCVGVYIYLCLQYILLSGFLDTSGRSVITLSDAKISPQCQRLIRMPENISLCQNKMPWRSSCV